jgi:hypothetical protein
MGVSTTVFDRKWLHYTVAAILLASLVPLQTNIDRRRVEERLVLLGTDEDGMSEVRQPGIRPGEAAIGLLLAGFRGLAANMLWFRITVLFQQGRVTEEIPLFQAISLLQPRFRATWAFGAWHMAYNVSAYFFEREDLSDEEVDDRRYRCFKIAEDFLRKGINYNYYHYDLHWDLGFSILYYKQYKLCKEKGWPEEGEALRAALKEMKVASLFQPPLAVNPAYVGRIIAIVMKEGGMLDDAYKMWYRLKNWPREDQNMRLVEKHMKRVVAAIIIEQTKAYALDLEKEGNFADAYKTWYKLLTDEKKRQAELAEDQWADSREVKLAEDNVQSFAESAGRLEDALKQDNQDIPSLQRAALQEETSPALRKRIDNHFRSLEEQAAKELAADRAETRTMYRKLTKPAPGLDWWVLLFVPFVLLAVGRLIFGKETYAS